MDLESDNEIISYSTVSESEPVKNKNNEEKPPTQKHKTIKPSTIKDKNMVY